MREASLSSESSPNTCWSRVSWSAAVVWVSPHSAPSPPEVPVSPNRSFAASRPSACPMMSHSVDADALSLFVIISVAYVFSAAVRCRSASCAWSSSVARMSTLTMLAVSKAPWP